MKHYTEIKSYEDACSVNGDDPTKLPDLSMLSESEAEYLVTHLKVIRIVKALNTLFDPEWKPNFFGKNANRKYFPWPLVKADKERPSGFGFSDSYCGSSGTGTVVGSRLLLADPKLVEHVYEHFESFYIINQLSLDK